MTVDIISVFLTGMYRLSVISFHRNISNLSMPTAIVTKRCWLVDTMKQLFYFESRCNLFAPQEGNRMKLDAVYKTILESLNEPLYLCNLEQNILYINPAAEKLTGWS